MFTEAWFGVESQLALRDLYKLTEGVPGDVVEVGCWEGRSTVALARAARPELVHAVDTWEGSPGEISAELAGERDVFSSFKDNIARLTAGNVQPHRMGWRDYFTTHRQPIRFLHIDATHTYEEVAGNIDAALPLLADGAVICGDDIHHRPVREAVQERFPEAKTVATLWWHQIGG